MAYKTILLNESAYIKASAAKRKLSEKLRRKLSFSDLINEVFGKRIEFLDIDNELKAYIESFSERLRQTDCVLGLLLFGSVAKGRSYNKYSDIDLLVVVRDKKDIWGTMERIHKIKGELAQQSKELAAKQLPMFISPIVIDEKELNAFKPIYLDFLDYGIVLFEKQNVLTDFLNEMRKIKHSRSFRPYEVLTWKI
ncbi:MAG: nucleotidyltransferase domain-containing protein [Candidatus Micrarchaeaceae archaeon]